MGENFVIYEMVIYSKSHIFTIIQHLWKYLNLGGGSNDNCRFPMQIPLFFISK